MNTSSLLLPEQWYAGIGSRETPDEVGRWCTRLARALAAHGWGLRSGGARGADQAFEKGCAPHQRRIYLPKEGFEGRGARPGDCVPKRDLPLMTWMRAQLLAEQFHPLGRFLGEKDRPMMTRNMFQVLGDTLAEPASMIVCWAPPESIVWDGKRIVNVGGGTGQAVRLAADRGIPVYHLALPEHRAILRALCNPSPPSSGVGRRLAA